MRRLRSCNASRNWAGNSRRRKRETISESRNRVGTWGSHREWHLELRQQIRRGADQRSFYLHNSQEQCRRGRFAGGCGITRQLEGTTRFDTDSVAGLDWPWSDRRRCAFPLVLPGAVFCFRGERVTSSKDALYLGSPARSTTSQRALGAVTGARPSHSHCGSIPPLAVPGVPAHNNLAERSVRPLVIARKISGGTRSPHGSQTRMALFSLFGSWAAQGLNPFFRCLAVLAQPNPLS